MQLGTCNKNVGHGSRVKSTCNYQIPQITLFWLLTSLRLQSNTVIHKHMLKGEICLSSWLILLRRSLSLLLYGNCLWCCCWCSYSLILLSWVAIVSHRLPVSLFYCSCPSKPEKASTLTRQHPLHLATRLVAIGDKRKALLYTLLLFVICKRRRPLPRCCLLSMLSVYLLNCQKCLKHALDLEPFCPFMR